MQIQTCNRVALFLNHRYRRVCSRNGSM